MLTEDEKLRSEILNLFKYIQKMREEIAQVHVRMDERTHFESAEEHLDEIVAATEKATDSILENLEKIDSVADQIREGGDASALCDQINEKTMAAIESLHVPSHHGAARWQNREIASVRRRTHRRHGRAVGA